MTWRVALGPGVGDTVEGEPTEWTSLAVNLRLSDACDCTINIPGKSLAALLVDELATDLWVWWNATLVFRGRVTAANDKLDRDGNHTTDLHATDYRGVLDRRVLLDGDTLTYTQVAQAEIVWALIAATQARPGGQLGIARGLVPAGTPRDRTFELGASVGELIDSLSNVIGGFDWQITPGLDLYVHTPQRGIDAGDVLEYGGAIADFDRTSAAGNFANVVRVAGDQSLTPATATATDISTTPKGRWELAVSEVDLKLQSTVNDRAPRILADRQFRPDVYRVALVPGAYMARDPWLAPGDTLLVKVESGRLDLAERARITEVAIDASEDGGHNVSLAMVRVP